MTAAINFAIAFIAVALLTGCADVTTRDTVTVTVNGPVIVAVECPPATGLN